MWSTAKEISRKFYHFNAYIRKAKRQKLNTPLKKLEDKNDRINHKKVKKKREIINLRAEINI